MVCSGCLQLRLFHAGGRVEHVGPYNSVRGGGFRMEGQSDWDVGQLGKHRVHNYRVSRLLFHGH